MHKPHDLPKAFADLGLNTPILHALEKIGFEKPSDIQAALIPLALEGKDVLGQAKTGTGKTGAFGLPIVQMIDPANRLQALILVPTRELAVQVTGELRRFSPKGQDLHIVPVYGGQKIATQLHLLGRKPHIIVATPGRAMDFLSRGAITFEDIRFVVLDEVDRMLDIGFRDDIRRILSQVKTDHQTIFVSATLSDEIKRLANQYMKDAVEINVSRDELTVEGVEQTYITVDPWDKFRLLTMLIEREDVRLGIIFCNTKHAARKLARRLHDAKIDAKEIHGDLVQQKRERVMDRFRKHKLKVLVATDLAARGIDVNGISHIINYDAPVDPHVYVHRIGRTARMGTFGKAITLATREEGKVLTEIEMLINKQITLDTVDGFEPSEPPDRGPREARRPPPPSRYEVSVSAPGSEGEAAVVQRPKRLGSKFKPARRRR